MFNSPVTKRYTRLSKCALYEAVKSEKKNMVVAFKQTNEFINGHPQGVIQFYSFKSTELFKGSPNNASDIGVERGEWSSSFPCSQVGLPNTDGEYFVFATGSGSLFEVETCNRIFAWDCIPQSDKDRLPLTCSN